MSDPKDNELETKSSEVNTAVELETSAEAEVRSTRAEETTAGNADVAEGEAAFELGPNVTTLEHNGATIHIIGTAHISEQSVHEVRETIEAIKPDTVCVELCEMRYQAIRDENRWKKLDVFQVLKQKKVLFVLANLALSAYQRKLGDKLGVKPGSELVEAINAAEDTGAELVLVDRDIQATLKRTWANLSFWNKFAVLGGLMEGVGSDEELTEEQIESLKEKDNISDMMKAFAEEMPQVKVPLIDERDLYLMSSIEAAPGAVKVAVVGAGHVEGMVAHSGEEVDLEALSVIPPPSKLLQVFKWIIPTIILCAFYYGWQEHSGAKLKELLLAWLLPNSIMAALLCMVAGAKLLSVLTAFVASPITSLNPTIGAGMVVGLVEAWLRKPTVEDAENLSQDFTSLRGAYKNPFSRVLIVAIMATLGSAIGAWIGAGLVLSNF
jgi:pheromone shutdown-related protein TraB